MRKLKFRAPSSSSQTSAVRLETLVMLAPSAWPCPLGNLIHEGKILRKPELHPQTWKDNVPTVLPDVVSLSDMDSGGWFCWGSDAFFGKYQISSPFARLPLHSQIQPDRVLPTGLRGERKLDLHAELTLHFIQAAARFSSQGRRAQFDRSFKKKSHFKVESFVDVDAACLHFFATRPFHPRVLRVYGLGSIVDINN